MKYEFISPQWFAALHGVICERVATAATQYPALAFSICEVFSDVPDRLATMPGGRSAWHAIIRGAHVDFALEELDGVDYKVWVDYQAVLPLSRYDTMGQAERMRELADLGEALRAAGKFRTVGARPKSAEPIGSFHDAIARLTA